MVHFRFPVNMFLPRIIHYLQYSSDGFSEKAYQELLKHVTNQDKIKTDEFRKLVPYLRDRDKQLENFTLAKKVYNFTESVPSSVDNSESHDTQEQNMKVLTNIFDTMPEIKEPMEYNPSISLAEGSSLNNSSTATDPTAIEEPPKSLGVVIVADPETRPVKDRDPADLTSALLPLALHNKDVRYNLLTTALAQDVQHIYCKATEIVQHCYMKAHVGGTLLYSAVRNSNSMQVLARQQSVALTIWRDKTALWLSDATKPETSTLLSASAKAYASINKSAKTETPASSSTSPKTETPASPSTSPKTKTPDSPSKSAETDKPDVTAAAIKKIKKTIESVVAALRQKIEQQKKDSKEKK